MKNVNVDKIELIRILTENRAIHIKEYAEMMIEYKKEIIAECQKLQEFNMAATSDFKKRLTSSEPVSNEQEYDTILSMLSMSIDSNISLSTNEYTQYVLNEWFFTNSFEMSKSAYIR